MNRTELSEREIGSTLIVGRNSKTKRGTIQEVTQYGPSVTRVKVSASYGGTKMFTLTDLDEIQVTE